MAENFWICTKCGHHNSMYDKRCARCHHKITPAEIEDAKRREESAEDFDRVMNRRFHDDSDDSQMRHYARRTQNYENTIPTRLKEMKSDMAIDRRQPFYLRMVQLIVNILLILAIIAFAYSLFTYVRNGFFDGLTTAASKFGSSVFHIFSNTYNYFLNLNFSNNALVRVGSIIGKNLVNLFTIIGRHIMKLVSLL